MCYGSVPHIVILKAAINSDFVRTHTRTPTCSTYVRARVHNASQNVNFDLIPRAFRYQDGAG